MKQHANCKNNRMDEDQLKEKIKHKLMLKTSSMYGVFRIRQKISYSAFQRRMTIVELFVTEIQKSFNTLQKQGCLKVKPISKHLIDYSNKVLSEGSVHCIKGIIEINGLIEQNLSDEEVKKVLDNKIKKMPTIIPVKQNGVMKQRMIDEEANEKYVGKITNMRDKTKCFDIFYDAIIDGKRMV